MAETVTHDQIGARLRKDRAEDLEMSEQTAFIAATKGVAVVAADTPVSDGTARNGWDARRAEDGADLYNDVPHIGIVERGSRPHWPPFEPILRWVVRTFGADFKNTKRSKRSFEGPDSEEVSDEARAMAYAVQAHIADEGTEPNYMVRDNMDVLLELWRRQQEAQRARS